ncbi:MAG: ribosome recycling factor [Alphaproteobacteria bacterium]|jgi:ribosome recycling factor|nr:ribosome recycling factor [Alphaproteobacteria bacterium]
MSVDLDDIGQRMNKAIEVLRHEFGGLRTGRASASLLEPVVVNAYGSNLPIAQVGTVSVPEPRMISVQVWDKANVKAVEKAIRDSGLGLNPQADGTLVRIPIPELNEQRRKELTKVAGQYAEHAKVAVRNVRRDGMDGLKKMQKDGHVSEDEVALWQEEIQELTDKAIARIDEVLATKQKEIMQV